MQCLRQVFLKFIGKSLTIVIFFIRIRGYFKNFAAIFSQFSQNFSKNFQKLHRKLMKMSLKLHRIFSKIFWKFLKISFKITQNSENLHEERYTLKFCVKLKKMFTETKEMLDTAYNEPAEKLSCFNSQRWCRRFRRHE